MKNITFLPIIAVLLLISCVKDENTTTIDTTTKPQLILKYKFDSTQQRLDNFGKPAIIPTGNAAQTPNFKTMGASYIELTPSENTGAYFGEQLYKSPEISGAIDFDNALYGKDGEQFFSIDLDKIQADTYKYLRVSLSYQKFEIDYTYTTIVNGTATNWDLQGTLSSFVGSKSYIKDYTIKNKTVSINGIKNQGYWGFETFNLIEDVVFEGQAPGTTVPNPIAITSPIPLNSCLVTGVFPAPLTITGTETEDIIVEVSISINNSFEWKDNGNGKFEPSIDQVVDMGVRGMIPVVK